MTLWRDCYNLVRKIDISNIVKYKIMSVYSNQGPLRRIERSTSNNSLYTDNSDKSDSPPKKQTEPLTKIEPKVLISKPI